MIVIGYISFYLFLIFIMLLTHYIFTKGIRQFDRSVEDKRKKWAHRLEKMSEEDNYKLSTKEVRRLRNPMELKSFFNEVDTLDNEKKHDIVLNNSEDIINVVRKSMNETMMAFYAHLISELKITKAQDEFKDFMLELIKGKSVYLRENALRAIYSFGDKGLVVKAIKWLSDNDVYHDKKLISDGLVTYAGDSDDLCEALAKALDECNDNYKDAIIRYFSYAKWTGGREYLVNLLERENTNTDIVCSIIRTVCKEKSEENRKILIDTINKYCDAEDKGPAIVATTFVGRYTQDEQIQKLLQKNISSSDWYIRMNSAKSLIECGASDAQIQQILNGDDRFAKDALEYMLHVGVSA